MSNKRKHLEYKELENTLAEANDIVPPGSVWRHFKGGQFRVIRVVFDSEALQLEVVHEPVENPNVAFCRSLRDWLETVSFKGYTLSRFERIEDAPED